MKKLYYALLLMQGLIFLGLIGDANAQNKIYGWVSRFQPVGYDYSEGSYIAHEGAMVEIYEMKAVAVQSFIKPFEETIQKQKGRKPTSQEVVAYLAKNPVPAHAWELAASQKARGKSKIYKGSAAAYGAGFEINVPMGIYRIHIPGNSFTEYVVFFKNNERSEHKIFLR